MNIRSLLEQSCTVWNSELTQEDSENLERMQKSALRTILQERFTSYESALNTLELESLAERREILCIQFTKKCTKKAQKWSIFPHQIIEHIQWIQGSSNYMNKSCKHWKIAELSCYIYAEIAQWSLKDLMYISDASHDLCSEFCACFYFVNTISLLINLSLYLSLSQNKYSV